MPGPAKAVARDCRCVLLGLLLLPNHDSGRALIGQTCQACRWRLQRCAAVDRWREQLGIATLCGYGVVLCAPGN